jgi:ELWxxDGT repeat protein
MRTLPILLLSLALMAAAPAAFTPYLVKDINPEATPANSVPSSFVTLGGLALFQVQRLGQGELWRSDGTASGTYRLAENGYTEILANTGGLCFFRFQSADNRWHLWVTDGTLPGTFSLAETSAYWPSVSAAWVPPQGVLYFSFEAGQGHGTELWRTDGTPGGTYEVADIVPGPGSSDPTYLTSFQGRLYFAADSALWRSDGTAQGTALVRDVPAVSIYVVGSRLVFLGTDAAHGFEPWASDGTTAGTRRIADLAKGTGSPVYHAFKVIGKRLFFTATASAARGQELYVTDGTAQGTRALTSFSDPYALDQLPQAALGNRLLFAARNRANGVELWSSEGTAKGTRLVLDACPGECPSYPTPLLQHGGRLYYQARDATHGDELWVTDGTARGTRMVKDICPGQCDSWPWIVSAAGDRLFFGTWDEQNHTNVLWTTDGTAEGTVPLAEVGNIALSGTAAGGELVFSAFDPDHGDELWVSDGTPDGTRLLADIADEDLGGSEPHSLMTLGDRVLFLARGFDGPALWTSDGTEAGTVEVRKGLSRIGAWTASASRVFFQADPRQGSFDLWTSDGTEAGTLRLNPVGVRAMDGLSQPVIKLGSRVFFSGWTMEHGSEPWITDGTRAGTRRVADLRPGTANSSPRDFTVFAGRAFFVARFRLWKSDGTAKGTIALGPELRDIQPRTTYAGRLWFTGHNSRYRTELWATDGTAARTVRIAELRTVEQLTVHAGRLWFLGDGTELWSTDGTAAGTRRLDLQAPVSEPFGGIVSDGLRLYLTDFQRALWVSDGTAAGTRRISDQGAVGPSIAFGDRLYYVSPSGDFYTSDGTEAGTRPVRPDGTPRFGSPLRFGNRLVLINYAGELWQSDGTAEGTKLIRDLSPETYSSLQIVKAGPRLFFPAWEEETGWELWAMRD